MFTLSWVGMAVSLSFVNGDQPVVGTSDSSRIQRPNIVLFFIDDLGYRDLGCYGSESYQTPSIDRMAAQSIRMTQFYSANPVCSPTRAALMTGKAPHRLGITQWINQPNDLHLPHSETTLGEALKQAGYRTGYIGKWHLGEKDDQLPLSHGFNWMRCVNRGGAPGSYFFPFKGRSRNGIRYWDVPDLEDRKQGDYLTDELTDQAIEFIGTPDQDQPFFLCFAHYAVHTPIQSPEKLVAKYKKQFARLPEVESNFVSERNNAKSRLRQDHPGYAAMVENLDTNVGRVLKHLENQEMAANTIIVFTSDNGGLSTLRRIGPTSCLPLRAGKGWTYEGGIRIPTMFCWPGTLEPGSCEVPGITMDLYPTLLDLVGAEANPEQHRDGISLVSAFKGSPVRSLKERFLAWTYPHHHGSQHSPSNAMRMGKWKLVQKTDDATPEAQRLELYNLDRDVGETKNLVDEFPDRAAQMKQRLESWLESTSPR